MEKMEILDKEIVVANVKLFIQANGYSKQSFAKKLNIPCLALDQILADKMLEKELHKHPSLFISRSHTIPSFVMNE